MTFEARLLAPAVASAVLVQPVGCAPSKASVSPTPAPHAARATAPAASPTVAAVPYEQPRSCPPPLAWEDGSAIETNEVCKDAPAFFFHEGACCRYENGCLAPENAASYEKLDQCEEVRAGYEERRRLPPVCNEGELVWQPAFCVFAHCELGQFATPARQSADCERPLGLNLRFELDEKKLSGNHIGSIENFAIMADVLGVTKLRVEGGQSYDEKPDAKSKTPLSLERATMVRDALARVTRIPIEVEDGGTTSRTRGTASLFRTVSVTMTPLARDHAGAKTTPFTLPWSYCESSVTFRAQIALTKHDGAVLAEVCRDKACSRAVIDASYWATWPGGGGDAMKGDFDALLGLNATRQQQIRTGLHMTTIGGAYRGLDGAAPAFFDFDVSFRGEAISEASTYSLKLYRRRTELALDWSGKLEFERKLRHPTRDKVPCLRAELEIPRKDHSLR
jgi:hypothetical protein